MLGKRFTAEKIINMLREAKVLVERWRREYNHIRPHSSLGYRPPAPEVVIQKQAGIYYNKKKFTDSSKHCKKETFHQSHLGKIHIFVTDT